MGEGDEAAGGFGALGFGPLSEDDGVADGVDGDEAESECRETWDHVH